MTYYRNGEHNARNLYREPGEHDHIGCMFTEEDGRLAARALNFLAQHRCQPARRGGARDVIADKLRALLPDAEYDLAACADAIIYNLLCADYHLLHSSDIAGEA